ncbi:hypothetical protein [Actinomadura fibrosa]|uniref:HNH endonuclease n=1 Tax=Actinomadura fibrosa TaxID=111802 RepID=A0ABW2XSI4_9ACTN|nr:hypothetical protein [Actinomadura fibrosa]
MALHFPIAVRGVSAALLVPVLAAGCGGDASTPHRARPPSASGKPSGTPGTIPSRAAGTCHATSTGPAVTRPDRTCTPGATNPAVTQATIKSTVCRPGYTRSIRPPASYTDRLKVTQIRWYGYRDHRTRSYEEDHFLPLSLGGAPSDPRNLWPEPGASPNPKDDVEFSVYRGLCEGKVTLAAAQHAMLTNWTTALAVLHLPAQHPATTD